MIFIGCTINDYDQENPFRICVSCLTSILTAHSGIINPFTGTRERNIGSAFITNG